MTEPTERARFNRFLVGLFGVNADLHTTFMLDTLLAAARAEERERCAKIAEADAPEFYDRTCHRIAARIRSDE